MILIVMGVSGSGKTTVGRMLAARLKWDFVDADDYHPHQNRLKMQNGIPLTDEDRAPWLETLKGILSEHRKSGMSMVLACSALRHSYRTKLGIDQDSIRTVYLKAAREELAARLAERKHAFFDPALLDSQLKTLDEPDSGLILPIGLPPEELVDQIVRWIET